MRIETDRFILRPFSLEDALPSFEMNQDPDVNKYTGEHVKDLAQMQHIIEHIVLEDYKKYGFGRLAIELKENGEFIGFSGIKYLPEMNEVDIGYRLKKKYWRKGIATESARLVMNHAFDELKLKRIIGLVIPENIASENVLKKLGLVFEKHIVIDNFNADYYAINR